MAKATTKEKLHSLMYSLLYPAVLGTMIVGSVFASAKECFEFDYRFSFAIFLIFYFSSQHIENASESEDYSSEKFILDFIETCIIFALFLLLDIYDFRYSVVNVPEGGWNWFYSLLIITFLIPIITRARDMDSPDIQKIFDIGQSKLSLSACGISVLGLFFHESALIIIALTVVLFFYLANFVFSNEVADE